ncbi:MAG: branched-chain amino acid ABC transporter permease [Deltaproteobacteria bacterium]|jgi:branched-chain amino acid transport system permease protein|nr:branched-chain amino acid ABC transporter permease [Deltaproteobacteria bacterium]
MLDFDFFLQQLSNGLTRGSIYALIALGYTMVYGVMKLINFAHGELFTLGAYFGYALLVTRGVGASLGPPLAIGVTMIMVVGLTALAGHLLERVAYRPLRHSDRLAAVVSALGASIFLQNAIMLKWGAQYRAYGADLLPNVVFHIGSFNLPLVRVLVFVMAVAVMACLHLFIHRTRLGLAVRAAAIDQGAAKLMGIDVRRVIAVVFIIGPALGGLAGLLVGLYYGQINFNMGQLYGLKAFTAAIIGGIGNITGAMVGGMLLGLLEALGEGYVSSSWKDALTFVVLIMILVVRPTGLLPERVAEKL